MKHTLRSYLTALVLSLFFISMSMGPIIAMTTQKCSSFSSFPTAVNTNTYKLLIITPSYFKDELCMLVTHKQSMGTATRLVSLDEVYSQMFWQGRDEAEKVKYFIKKAYEEWNIEYVLLVGGRSSQFLPTWHCPVRYVSMVDDWEAEYLSDLYFADIYDAEGNFSSWDSDGDGIYGEWYSNENAQDENIDLIPDIAVGRLPCRTKREVTTMVRKIIAYETNALTAPWFHRMLVAAGDTYPESYNPNWTGYEGEYYAECAIENMSEFPAIRLYTSDGTFSHKKDVIREWRNGFGFVYLVGHGSPKQWGNNAPNGTSFIQGPNSYDMWRLRNQDRLPVCIVSGCHNSQFDVCLRRAFNPSTLWKQEYVPECWSERLIHQRNGGAIAVIGCTALGYTKEDKTTFQGGLNELECSFFEALGQHKITILGDTWIAALSWYAQTYPVDWNTPAQGDAWIDAKVMQSWVLLGDPSLRIG